MKKEDSIEKEIFEIQTKLRNDVIKDLKKYIKKNSEFKLFFDPRIKKLDDYKGCKVYIVNGELIRKKIDIDFVMGGNGLRYLYVPIDEIWIDDAYEDSNEINQILLHEHTETELMKKGLSYGKAHDNASIKELKLRRKS